MVVLSVNLGALSRLTRGRSEEGERKLREAVKQKHALWRTVVTERSQWQTTRLALRCVLQSLLLCPCVLCVWVLLLFVVFVRV